MLRSLFPALPPQAWYREGAAAEKLERWEDAATGYYEAYMLQASLGSPGQPLRREAVLWGR